jgi:thiamine pyrophosphokinase
MKNTVVIISGGSITDPEFLKRAIEDAGSPVIVCADGAARHLRFTDIVPSVIIGDMDSIDEESLRYFDERGATILRYSRQKDETDTQLALEYALQLRPGEIIIFGALGGRIDHTLANIYLLVMAARENVPAKIIDETCELFMVTESCVIEGARGQTVSLLPVSSTVTGIKLEGFEYLLTDGTMEPGIPYGISNRLMAEEGRISVKTGCLLVIRYFNPDFEANGE